MCFLNVLCKLDGTDLVDNFQAGLSMILDGYKFSRSTLCWVKLSGFYSPKSAGEWSCILLAASPCAPSNYFIINYFIILILQLILVLFFSVFS